MIGSFFGSLTVFISCRDIIRISLLVPPKESSYDRSFEPILFIVRSNKKRLIIGLS